MFCQHSPAMFEVPVLALLSDDDENTPGVMAWVQALWGPFRLFLGELSFKCKTPAESYVCIC